MSFEIMRLVCMFDLPVDTDVERRAYRIFRKELIKAGFVMLQYSVYVRTCPNRDFAKGIEKKIQKFVPRSGNVRLLTVTEKQYDEMVLLVGQRTAQEKELGTERMVVL